MIIEYDVADFEPEKLYQRLRALPLKPKMAVNSPSVRVASDACTISASKAVSKASFSIPAGLSVMVPCSLTWVLLMSQPAAPSLLMAALISSCVGLANMLCMLLALRWLRKAETQPEAQAEKAAMAA